MQSLDPAKEKKPLALLKALGDKTSRRVNHLSPIINMCGPRRGHGENYTPACCAKPSLGVLSKTTYLLFRKTSPKMEKPMPVLSWMPPKQVVEPVWTGA